MILLTNKFLVMKKIIPLLPVFLLLTNCGYRIVRTNYTVSRGNSTDCEIKIQKNTPLPDSVATKIGEIKLGESGMTLWCNENDAMKVLRKEGCAINADIINIFEEKKMDLWSSCYRCRAEFYKLKM